MIAAGDEEAVPVVSRLCDAMQLRALNPSAPLSPAACAASGAGELPHQGEVRRLVVVVGGDGFHASRTMRHALLPPDDDGCVVRALRPLTHSDALYVRLMELSLVLAHDAQSRGGVLLHGALAERDGLGVILAAPGGTGKTTASQRLPAPWRSRCDDTTLVVRDSQGTYWAHPWPTWSRALRGEAPCSLDVQDAVRLRGLFFLSQSVEDRMEPVGPGHAVSLLVECAEQASHFMARGLTTEETRALRLERFTALCTLARLVPTHVLHISLTGAFWQGIEQMLEKPEGA